MSGCLRTLRVGTDITDRGESSMTAVIRIRRVDLWIAWLAAAMILVAATVAAERPIEGRRAETNLAPAKVIETLGPGPLVPRRDAIERPSVKAANLEDAIDQCVEANMSRLDAPGAAVAVILDTFLYDWNGDSFGDTDITFCSQTGDPGFLMWARNRNAVGERELTPRRGARSPAH